MNRLRKAKSPDLRITTQDSTPAAESYKGEHSPSLPLQSNGKFKVVSVICSVLLTLAGIAGVVVYLVLMPSSYGLIIASLLVILIAITITVTCCSSTEKVDPSGKAVFITGCDSGFGFSLTKQLDQLGFRIFAGCLFPDGDGAKELRDYCSSRLHVVKLDVTDDQQVHDAALYVRKNIGDDQLWALVNNAGIAVMNEIEWCSVNQYKRVLDVNVLGLIRVTKSFLPDLRRSCGRVVNVSSLAGRYTYPAFTAYSMSKSASISFTDGLRREMAKFGISVVSVEPGLYRTPITAESTLADNNRKAWAETPTEIRECYGEEYFAAYLDNLHKVLNKARPNVQEVVDMMVEGVVAKKPKYRYVPHTFTKVRASIIMQLPTIIVDRLLNSILLPKVVPKSKQNSPI